MYFSLSCRQSNEYLKQADEIIVEHRDIEVFDKLLELNTTKKITIKIPNDTEINWNYINWYSDKLSFTFCLSNISQKDECIVHNYPWYWAYPVDTWYELNGLLQNGVSQIIVGDNLFFDIERAYLICKASGVTLRIIPNLAFDGYIPRQNGITGAYIRPEDLNLYAPYVEVCEFFATNLSQEHALFEIYKRGKWNGNLNLIITNLNFNIDNRLITEDFGQNRLNCRHLCAKNMCSLCPQMFNFIARMEKNEEKNSN